MIVLLKKKCRTLYIVLFIICFFAISQNILQYIPFFQATIVSYAATIEPETTKQPSNVINEQTKRISESIQQGASYPDNLEQTNNGAKNTYFYVHSVLKSILPYVFVGCIVFGVIIIIFFRKNKGIRQRTFLKFCVIIPFIFLALVYSMPYFSLFAQLPISYVKEEHVKVSTIQDTSSPPETVSRYENVVNRINAAKESQQATSEAYQAWDGYSHINILLKKNLFVIILACEVSGICVIFLSGKKTSTKRWAKINLCIILPSLVLIVVYFIPVLQKIFVF